MEAEEKQNNIYSTTGDSLIFFVNGKKVIDHHPDPEISLLSYLRNKLRLTGTKLGCGEGGCGACTVMVSRWNRDSDKVIHLSVNACLAPVVSMHSFAVTTVEGIGSTRTKLHVVQERLAQNHGSQCGFCTPGIVMSMYTLLRNNPKPNKKSIEMCLQGNLCRCTGYRPIIKAFNTFANGNSVCGKNGQCCQKENNSLPTQTKPDSSRYPNYDVYDPTQESIFPPELKIMWKDGLFEKPSRFVGERVTWYRPTTLDQLTSLKEKYSNAPLVAGNTENGIETWVKGRHFPVLITPSSVQELRNIDVDGEGILVGAACTMTQIRNKFIEIVNRQGRKTTQALISILEMLHWFGGDQIRNVGVLGGNIMTASPISDLNPILLASESHCTFKLHSRGERTVLMDQNFFPSYRKTGAEDGEVLVRVKIPFTKANEYMKAYMQSRRREDDIAIVNTAMKVQFYSGTDKVCKFVAAFGGMAATTVMPLFTMKKMKERYWDDDLVEDVIAWLREDLPLELDAPGGMVKYREALAASFFFKFFVHVKDCLHKEGIVRGNINESDKSALIDIGGEPREFIETQTWEEVPKDQSPQDLLGRPIMHLSAEKQVTGEAVYVDDMTPYADELYLALVTSTKAHARIVKINTEAAEKSPGFVSWVDYRDVPGENDLGIKGEVFAKEKVTCVGHVIGAVVADNQANAQRAARLVQVTYEELHPVIITIEDAVKYQSFYNTSPHRIVCGDAEAALDGCDYVIEKEFRMGGQEHFYLETQACLAVPKGEDGEMEIFASTQDPSILQLDAANILNIDSNKILVRVKRLGGGFGGKETRFHVVVNPVVIAANKCRKPVRCMLSRYEDMGITGGRHPFLGRSKIGFMKNGKIISVITRLYSNAGNTMDLSLSVLDTALLSSNCCYKIPNLQLEGYACKTNVASNTAFRSFGRPQGMMICEDWIVAVAEKLQIPPEQIRDINLFEENDTTSFGQRITNFQGRRCWEECLEKSDFEKTKLDVEKFNNNNRWRKRGISGIPMLFGVRISLAPLNQAGALVHVYRDGSVLLTHGGTEMGQGLHTKMAQIANRSLGIPMSRIHISETSTNTVPNTSPTAGSISSDTNGMAVKEACEKLLNQLKPVKEANPNLTWTDLVYKAYTKRVNLSATGFYKTPGLEHKWDRASGKFEGNWYRYFTYGAGVSLVEIDCLTGDHTVLRTDIVMDVGRSLNPTVDIGQIEGGFLQGYGLFTLEETLHTPSGHLLARGPGAYKIPGFGDCPKEFNVHLLKNSYHDEAVYSSKAIGEPPLFLSSSVFFGIRDAIKYARKDSGLFGNFPLNSPATAERIRMACADNLTQQHALHKNATEEELQPWSIQS